LFKNKNGCGRGGCHWSLKDSAGGILGMLRARGEEEEEEELGGGGGGVRRRRS
jgi:hypothetical protein